MKKRVLIALALVFFVSCITVIPASAEDVTAGILNYEEFSPESGTTEIYELWFPCIDNTKVIPYSYFNSRIYLYSNDDSTVAFIDENYDGILNSNEQSVSLIPTEVGYFSSVPDGKGIRIVSEKPISGYYYYSTANNGIYDDSNLCYESAIKGKEFVVPVSAKAYITATDELSQIDIGSLSYSLERGELLEYSASQGDIISGSSNLAVTLYSNNKNNADNTWAFSLIPVNMFGNELWIPPKVSPVYYNNIKSNSQTVYITDSDGTVTTMDAPLEAFQYLSSVPVTAYSLFDVYAIDPWTHSYRHYTHAYSIYPYFLLSREYSSAKSILITRDGTDLYLDSDHDGVYEDIYYSLNAGDLVNEPVRTVSPHRSLNTPDSGSIYATNPVYSYFTRIGNWNYIDEATLAYSVNPVISLKTERINHPPVIQSVENITAESGNLLEFNISASDEDGDTLTYTVSDLPLNATFTDQLFSWIPVREEIGPYEICFVVDDGTEQSETVVSILVIDGNHAPVLGDLTIPGANEGEECTFAIPASDLDNDTLTYSINENYDMPPEGLYLNPNTGEIVWTPDYLQDGTYTFVVTISDGYECIEAEITITVHNVNRNPSASDQTAPEITENTDGYSYNIIASDPDGDPLTYSSADMPEGMVLNSENGEIRWKPSYDQSGEYSFSVNVSDGEAVITIKITILVKNVNRPPVASLSTGAVGYEGITHMFDASASTDPDGDTLSYIWDFGDGLSGSGISAGHVFRDNGEYTVILTVTDPEGLSASDNTSVLIENSAPEIEYSYDGTFEEGMELNLEISVTDPGSLDTHTLSIDWGDRSEIQTFPINIILTATHVYLDNGNYPVLLEVMDDDGASVNKTFDITVENVAPEVNAGLDVTISEGDCVEYNGTFFDPGVLDTHNIVWLMNDGDNIENICSFCREYADDGIYEQTLIVTDNDGGRGQDDIIVTVTNVPPDVKIEPVQDAFAGENIAFKGTFTDRGVSDTHTVRWSFGDGNSAEGTLEPSHFYTEAGTYTVTLTVTDDDGGETGESVNIRVSPMPAVINLEPDTFNLNSKGLLTACISLPDGFDPENIDENTVTCNGVPAEKCMICYEDQAKYIAKFDRQKLAIGLTGESISFSVCGNVIVEDLPVVFNGEDSLKVIDQGSKNKEENKEKNKGRDNK